MLKKPVPLRGHIDRFALDSKVLRDNALGDPHRRDVTVYLPPEYDGSTEQRGDHDDNGCQDQSPDIVRNHGSEHEIPGVGPPALSEALLAGLPGPTEFDSPEHQGDKGESDHQPVSALDCE